MTFGKTILIASFLSFNITLNSQAQQEKIAQEKIAAVIAKSNRLFSQGFEHHQAALVLDRYCTDGTIMAPNMPSITGPGGFMAFFNGGYEHGIRKADLRTTKIFGFSGDFVNEEGLYELKDEKGQTIDQGKYIVVWKKTKEGWKMYRDIFNTNISASK